MAQLAELQATLQHLLLWIVEIGQKVSVEPLEHASGTWVDEEITINFNNEDLAPSYG